VPQGLARRCALTVALALLGACRTASDGGAQASHRPSAIARLRGTSHPDFSGVWQALNEANWNLEGQSARAAIAVQQGVPNGAPVPSASVLALGAIGGVPASLSVVEGGLIPYTAAARVRRDENFAHALERDPEVKCMVPGVPRATYIPYPFQITHGPTKIMMNYGFSNAGRTIHLDRVEPPLTDYWMGHSTGDWEGDTLVVTVTHQNDQTWFDRAGNFHSSEMRVTERYTAVSNDHLLYEATIEDPQTFMRPWKIKMPLYRRIEDHAQVLEYRCVEMVEELLYGHLRKEQLVKRAEHDHGRLGGNVVFEVVRRPSRIADQ
jgi:hypothetical protein